MALIQERPFKLEPRYDVRNDNIPVPWADEEIAIVREDWIRYYKNVRDKFSIYETAGFTVEDLERFCKEVMVCMAFCDLYKASTDKPSNETYASIKYQKTRCRLLIIHRLQLKYPWLAAPKNRGAFGLAVDREFRDYQEELRM